MKNGALCLLSLVIMLSGAYHIRAEGESDSNAKKKDVISVYVVPPGQPVAAGKRVVFAVKIKNVSDRPIDLPWPKYIDRFISTESTARDQTVLIVRHSAQFSLGHGVYPGGDLKPSEEITVEVWHIFPDAGWHTLKCVLETSRKAVPWWSFWEGRVESESISVEVKQRKN